MKYLLTIILTLFITTFSLSQIIMVPSEQQTIQAGINAAKDGDTILVAEGKYLENINFKGKAITVASHLILDQDTSHVSKTIIDGSQPNNPDSGSVVTFSSGEDTTSVIYGFTITGGTGLFEPSIPIKAGGGIVCSSSGGKILNNIIENNSLVADIKCDGSAISAGPPFTNSIIVIRNNKIRNNYAEGASNTFGGVSVTISAIIENNEVSNNNTISNIGNCASGIFVHHNNIQNKKLLVVGNIISHNKANSMADHVDGGLNAGIGIAYVSNGLISNNIIKYNEVSAKNTCYAPGIFIERCESTLVIENNEIGFNNFTDGECRGGGISLYKANSTVVGNNIHDNLASYGGGIFLLESNSEIIGNRIYNNSAEQTGGGIYSWDNSNPKILNNVINNNSAAVGGGGIGFIDNSNAHVINNTIVENYAVIGGGIACLMNSNPIIMNTIIFGNKADSNGSQVALLTEDSEPMFSYCNIEGGITDFKFWIDGSIYSGTYENNIDYEPLFTDTLYNLSDTSPCIGTGIDSVEISGNWYHCPSTDLLGGPRPHSVDPYVDIGAIESTYPWDDPTGFKHISNQLPNEYQLEQNYPNPFNPSTTIKYQLPAKVKSEKANVKLIVYDVLGREIATLVNKKQNPDNYEVSWDGLSASGGQVPSGVYFYQLTAGNFVETRKMILLR